jgi:hypothetical protein
MKIELIMDEEKRAFFDKQKRGNDELIVPLDRWNTYIHDNLGVNPDCVPDFSISGAFVITERSLFLNLVENLGWLFCEKKRLTKEQGGFWFVVKLEPKKKMPKRDIFDVGNRQPGGFRSNS